MSDPTLALRAGTAIDYVQWDIGLHVPTDNRTHTVLVQLHVMKTDDGQLYIMQPPPTVFVDGNPPPQSE